MAIKENIEAATRIGDPVREGIEAGTQGGADESNIRERAYAIWEEQGRPEGSHDAHWHQAQRELTDKQLSAGDPSPTGP